MEKLNKYKNILLCLSIFGFCVFNIPFLYYAYFYKDIYLNALSNPISLVFMGEAIFILLLCCFFIIKFNLTKPGAIGFIILSLAGTLAFSIPFFLYLQSKKLKVRWNENYPNTINYLFIWRYRQPLLSICFIIYSFIYRSLYLLEKKEAEID